jgi:hypothetical protein
MTASIKKFDIYLNKLEVMLLKAAKEKDAGTYLFENNFRSPVFMLQGLCRVYARIHNKKKFEKIKEKIKAIEDLLGQVDYYHSLALALKSNKKINVAIKQYLLNQEKEIIAQLNNCLLKDKWINADEPITTKIKTKLGKADWLNNEQEVKKIASYYNQSIEKITHFLEYEVLVFDNVETDLHELRRKLRWLSIYPLALQGTFQFSSKSVNKSHLRKYLTPDIVASPYNKLVTDPTQPNILYLNKSYFLALSWLIASLGALKDEGLLISGLAEAIKVTSKCHEKEAMEQSTHLLGQPKTRVSQILKQASLLVNKFMAEQNLNNLLTAQDIK